MYGKGKGGKERNKGLTGAQQRRKGMQAAGEEDREKGRKMRFKMYGVR